MESHNFLLADTEGINRIIIYATDDSFKKLCETDTVQMDGTFYTCPSIFTQLYTIHGIINSKVYSLAYVFLPNKSRDTYLEMFRMLQNKAIDRQMVFAPAVSSFLCGGQHTNSFLCGSQHTNCLFFLGFPN